MLYFTLAADIPFISKLVRTVRKITDDSATKAVCLQRSANLKEVARQRRVTRVTRGTRGQNCDHRILLSRCPIIWHSWNGGFQKWGYPKMVGLQWKIQLKWMMTGGTHISGNHQMFARITKKTPSPMDYISWTSMDYSYICDVLLVSIFPRVNIRTWFAESTGNMFFFSKSKMSCQQLLAKPWFAIVRSIGYPTNQKGDWSESTIYIYIHIIHQYLV